MTANFVTQIMSKKKINCSFYGSGPKNHQIPNLKLVFLRWLRFGRTENKPEEQKYIRGAVENKQRG